MSYKQNFKPKLVVIEGSRGIRYVDGIRDQIVEIDWSIDKKQLRKDIEHFRLFGLAEAPAVDNEEEVQ